METQTSTQNNISQKYKEFKSVRKRTPDPRKTYAGTFPNMQDKILAYQCALYDSSEEDYDFMCMELEEACKFDPWRAFLYLQQIAAEMTDLAIRAFRLMLENMKRKPKENFEANFAEPVNESEYNFQFTGNYDGKKFPKKGKRYEKWSREKTKKGESNLDKELNARVYASEKGKPQPTEAQKAEKTRTTLLNTQAASSMAGEGGCKNLTWGSDDGGHFTACGPSFDTGYVMSMDW